MVKIREKPRRDEQRTIDERHAIIEHHSQLSTEKHTFWHARGPDSAHSPCIEPLDNLNIILLRGLRTQNRASVLVVRVMEKPLKLGALCPVMNVVEDVTYNVSHLEVFFPTSTPHLSILRQGAVLAIKEPLHVMNHGSKVIRVLHPSNIVELDPEHKLMPKTFQKPTTIPVRSIQDWSIQASEAFSRKEYTESVQCYSNAIGSLLPSEYAFDLDKDLYRQRAKVAMHTGQYELAKTDALKSLLNRDDEASKQANSEAYHCAGSAAYHLRDYDSAQSLFECLDIICPTDTYLGQVQRADMRLHEKAIGIYDFTAMLSQQKHADHATFTHNTTVLSSEAHGRGLYARHHLKRGDLVFCEKAFTVAHPVNPSPTDPHSTSHNNYYGGCGKGVAALWLLTVRKLFNNPSLAPQILTLYGGDSYTNHTNPPIVDGQLTLNVFQILQIVDHNVYGFEAGHAHHPYGTTRYSPNEEKESLGLFVHASYMNHSCLNNTSRSIIGDMMIVRATRDIPANTEITTSYLSPNIGEPNRTNELAKAWKFQCDCKLCASETACNANWKDMFDKVRSCRLPDDGESPPWDTALLNATITKAQQLLEEIESSYPNHLFKNKMPRIALRELQAILMLSNSRLGHHEKSREHALCLIRDSGYDMVSDGRYISMDCANGLATKEVVEALYLLARWEKDAWLAHQYLELAKETYLVVNGVENGWEVAYGEL